MTGRSDAQVVTAVLRVDCGKHSNPWHPRGGHWIRYPAADYWCACGFTDSASGDAVAAFVTTIRHTHRAACPNSRKDTTT